MYIYIETCNYDLSIQRSIQSFKTLNFRYENLMERAQAAMKSVDSNPKVSHNLPSSSASGQDPLELNDDDDEEEDDDVKDIDFNEEEVLKKCRDFLQVWSLTQLYSVDFSTIKDRCKKWPFHQTRNQGLRQLFLMVSWDHCT